jgi:outer membrane protein TolC
MNPVNFNRSLRLLKEPSGGSYSSLENYSSISSTGISVRQMVGLIEGEFNINSNLNYLNEFSRKRNNFSITLYFVDYLQKFLGGEKMYRLEKEIEFAKNKVAIKQYCTKLSEIQQEALSLYMNALISKMEQDLTLQTTQNNDILLQLAHIKLDNGYITEYDFKQMEFQSFNAQYAYENMSENFSAAQERLVVFWVKSNPDVLFPYFDVPIAIDTHSVLFYVKQNNPFSKQQEIIDLEAKRILFSVKQKKRFNDNINLSYDVNQYAEIFMDAYSNGNIRQSLSVDFQIPVSQWGINRNRIQIAENNYEASTLVIEKRIREFEKDVKESVNRYNHSMKFWLTSEEVYNLSQEQYRMLIQKFFLDKVSVYELTTVQSDQNDVVQSYYSVIRNTYNSYFTLRTIIV